MYVLVPKLRNILVEDQIYTRLEHIIPRSGCNMVGMEPFLHGGDRIMLRGEGEHHVELACYRQDAKMEDETSGIERY